MISVDGQFVLDKYLSDWANIYHADTCEVIRHLPANSIDFSVFSPPFEGLFVYSASDRDLGNTHGGKEFADHLAFIAREMFRIMKPGRHVAIHCMDLPTTLAHHGYIGFIDFPARLREVYERAGFIYHCPKITIWKDPEVQANRTYARQLTYGEMIKDSSMSGVGTPDYILIMRKPGDNEEPIKHDGDALAKLNDGGKPEHWQRVASPVWGFPDALPKTDEYIDRDDAQDEVLWALLTRAITASRATEARYIAEALANRFERGKSLYQPFPPFVWATANGVWKDGFVDYESPRAGNHDKRGIDQSDTLNYRSAREHDDERHICPLQTQVVDRLLDLYTKPGEILFTPFLGIGTEVVRAVAKGRRGVGSELKASYYKQAVAHVKAVEPGAKGQQLTLDAARKMGECSACGDSGEVGKPCPTCDTII